MSNQGFAESLPRSPLFLASRAGTGALLLGAHHPIKESRVPPLEEQVMKVYGPASQTLSTTGIILDLHKMQILI